MIEKVCDFILMKHGVSNMIQKLNIKAPHGRPKQPAKTRTMLIIFFNNEEIIHKESILSGQIVTGVYYLDVLKRLMARIHPIRPEYWDPQSWSFLHDNALIICRFLAGNQVCVPNNPPYVTGSLCFLFPKLKMKLKWCFFEDIPTDHLNSFHMDTRGKTTKWPGSGKHLKLKDLISDKQKKLFFYQVID